MKLTQEARSLGLYLTVLATFLASYGVQTMVMASFFLAVAGTVLFGYGLLADEE
jgi:hypothetical protein